LDYAAYIPVVNRPDLLRNVVDATGPVAEFLTIIDNSPDRWVERHVYEPASVFTPPVPLSFSQSMNWELEETLRQGRSYCMHMHNDAVIPAGACQRLLDYARTFSEHNPRWAVIYAHYDVLCVYNPKAYETIGGFDTNLPAYFSDNDWYRRCDLAGWTRINFQWEGIEIGHIGSQTINSDPYLKYLNSVTFPLYREYYRIKWGGYPGQELFTHPFGVRPKEWELRNSSLTSNLI
jgi:hypothetical protein